MIQGLALTASIPFTIGVSRLKVEKSVIQIKRKTLIHELTHCYIREYITHEEKNYSEEMVADISANSHDIIHKIVEDYFKGDK